jgi:ferric iron reductase protein FhuF
MALTLARPVPRRQGVGYRTKSVFRRVEGEPAVDALSGALARVTSIVSYLTAVIDPPESDLPAGPAASTRPLPTDGQWVPGHALIDDPPWLGRIIRSTGSGIGTDDPVVAASVFVQGYSYRVLTLTVACFTAAGVVPDASAAHLAVGWERNWPSRVAFVAPAVLVTEGPPTDVATITDALRFVVDTAIEAHLRPLLAAVRTGIGVAVGERLLWGNVAASAATAFRTMQGCLGDDVEPIGERFFALAPPEMRGLGSFLVVEDGERRGWFWERTNCCLFDRLPGGVRCADCSLTPTTERRAAYRESLAPS